MSDNNQPKTNNIQKSKEIKVQDIYKENTSIPDYSYWESQEWLDLRRQRNWWFGKRIAINNNTVYYATTSWFVTWNAGTGAIVTIEWYVWNTSTPTTLVAQSSISTALVVTSSLHIWFPVLKWEYYKILSTSTLLNWYFIPIY